MKVGQKTLWRFLAKVDIPGFAPDVCWLWQASKDSSGYGTFGYRGKTFSAHRFIYQMTKGGIPKSSCLMHSCDTPACVRVAHLRVGSQHENVLDSVKKGRHKNPRYVGDAHPGAVLNADMVRALREENAKGVSVYRLAKREGVKYGTLLAAIRGKNWKNI